MKGSLRRNQILECAKDIFSHKGYHKTHVEDILQEARIGKGTFYQYFKNKEDLFIALLVQFLDDWEKAVLTTCEPIKKTSGRSQKDRLKMIFLETIILSNQLEMIKADKK